MRRKKKFGLGAVLVVLILGLGFSAMGWWQWAKQPASAAEQNMNLTISEGAAAGQVAEKLEKDKVIRSALVFKYLMKSMNLESQLMPGEYVVSPHMSPQQIIELITTPQMPQTIRVTIPEGYTVKQIIQTFVNKGLAAEAEMTAVVTSGEFSYSFLQNAPAGFHRLEGYLFPDTYFFEIQTSPHDLIDTMLKRFNQELSQETLTLLAQRGLSIHEWVTIASMVEREAVKQDEMPKIASVILNRLDINMMLQIDATVQFLLPEFKKVLTYDDLKINSPYNTYIYAGLPPGPISSPGHASLQAILKPEKTDYLFYVAKGDGYHAFAKTYDEHLKNISKYQ